MSRGTFQTPRSLGAVTDIRPSNVHIRFNDDLGYRISATMEESEDVAGTLEQRLYGELDVIDSNLTASQRTTFKNLMKLLVKLYVAQEGYTNVTVS